MDCSCFVELVVAVAVVAAYSRRSQKDSIAGVKKELEESWIAGTFVDIAIAEDQEIRQYGLGTKVAVKVKRPYSGRPGLDLLEIVRASIQKDWTSADTGSGSAVEEEIL